MDDFHAGLGLGLSLGALVMGIVVSVLLINTNPTAPTIYTGTIAAAPSTSQSGGGNENILLTLSNNPNTVINCNVNLGHTSGQTQAYNLMTLKVGQQISLMQYAGNCTLIS